MSSPEVTPLRRSSRIAPPTNFLPLNAPSIFQEPSHLLTRTSTLQDLIRNRSTSNLSSLPHQPSQPRKSSLYPLHRRPSAEFGEPIERTSTGTFIPHWHHENSKRKGDDASSISRADNDDSDDEDDLRMRPRRATQRDLDRLRIQSEWERHANEDHESSAARERRHSAAWETLMTPAMRSMRLIGNSNPRYQWQRYYKSEEELKNMSKPVRRYYERNNGLIANFLYIDRLLDSSLPHDLLREYGQDEEDDKREAGGISTIHEGAEWVADGSGHENGNGSAEHAPARSNTETTITSSTTTPPNASSTSLQNKMKRTPKTLYTLPTETTSLLPSSTEEVDAEAQKISTLAAADDSVDSNSPVVTLAIYINFLANTLLLGAKIAVIVLTSSLSVLASLVDAALDFLSTLIVFITSRMIAQQDSYKFPIGRAKLEPLGVLVFSVIMITSFFQVALECFNRLTSGDREVVQLTLPAIIIMAGTVVVKGGCWFWCRLVKNSSVQALAQDAMTDVIFNTFSIIFPLVGYYLSIWWLDALGGLLLSFYVIFNWSRTSVSHINNLTGAAASADQRNILLYLTMRFAKTIKQIQGLNAYHAGDRLNVEVDIVLDESTKLRDSHDLGESLQYVLESVPFVERAFVHMDYKSDNIPTHMLQME